MNAIIPAAASAKSRDDVLILSDLFRDVSDEIFYDQTHINEVGYRIEARAIIDTNAPRRNTR